MKKKGAKQKQKKGKHDQMFEQALQIEVKNVRFAEQKWMQRPLSQHVHSICTDINRTNSSDTDSYLPTQRAYGP